MNPFWLFIIGVAQAILLLLLAPVYSGFTRVMRAKMHSRQGPPLMQNYRDIRKLMTRQEVVSEQAGWIFRVTPYLNLACMFLAAMIIPLLTTASPLEAAGDLILIVYLFALPRFFFAVAGLEIRINAWRNRRTTGVADLRPGGADPFAGYFRDGTPGRDNEPGKHQHRSCLRRVPVLAGISAWAGRIRLRGRISKWENFHLISARLNRKCRKVRWLNIQDVRLRS